MAQSDAHALADQAVLLGLLSREQARAALAEAEDGSRDALARCLARKAMLTSWQLDKLQKNELTGFFYAGCRVLFHIAEGSFARVYRGRRDSTGESVAIKVLRHRFASDPEAVARFHHEAEAGRKLVHPNIVHIHDDGEVDGAHFMTMEYVEGANLRDFLKIRTRVPAEQSLPMLIGLADGLAYSLARGVTHRDLKATNVLIGHTGTAKLVDFGLATVEGDARKMEQMLGVRTVDYATLERTCRSPKGDPRSDIFFLGCVFYHMLTGQPPLPENEAADPLQKMLKRGINSIRPISEHAYAPPPALAAIVEKMMKIDLSARYQSMDEVAADLRAYRAATSAPPPSRPSQPHPPAEDDPFLTDPSQELAAFRGKRLLCVEAQEVIQEAFRKALARLGFKVVAVRDADHAVERFEEDPPEAIIYDADGQGRAALDALLRIHEKAQESNRTLVALVLLGPRQQSMREFLPKEGVKLVALDKPVKMRDIQDALRQLLT
jgi:tRNA A-37 threonylcarbamoyl transferase component Bud32/ActR/RegA family two-component response regulator